MNKMDCLKQPKTGLDSSNVGTSLYSPAQAAITKYTLACGGLNN